MVIPRPTMGERGWMEEYDNLPTAQSPQQSKPITHVFDNLKRMPELLNADIAMIEKWAVGKNFHSRADSAMGLLEPAADTNVNLPPLREGGRQKMRIGVTGHRLNFS